MNGVKYMRTPKLCEESEQSNLFPAGIEQSTTLRYGRVYFRLVKSNKYATLLVAVHSVLQVTETSMRLPPPPVVFANGFNSLNYRAERKRYILLYLRFVLL
jgi:hypothetical protein